MASRGQRFDEDCDGDARNYDRTDEYVNHPQHYRRGPQLTITANDAEPLHHSLEAIEVIRWVRDARLANAMRYLWRVAFGGKWDDREDIRKAIWYLNDYLEHPIRDDA